MKKIFFLIFLLTFSLIFGFLYQTTRMDLTSLETVTQIRLQMTGDTYRQAYDVFYGVGDIVPDGDAWHDASLLVISQ